MRIVTAFLLFVLGIAPAALAEDVVKSEVITTTTFSKAVPADHSMHVVNFTQYAASTPSVRATLDVKPEGASAFTPIYQAELTQSVQVQRNMRVAGPADVQIVAVSGSTVFITYRVTRD